VGLCRCGIWVVVRLDNVGARVLAVDGLSKDFLGLWWRIVAGVEGGFPTVVAAGAEIVGFGIVADMGVVVGTGVMEFGSVAEMGVVGYGGRVAAEVEALASAPVGGGSRYCTGALQALLAPC
jgi:hypothetical protein